MPLKPLRPCRYPGCAELAEESYCDKHRRCSKQEYDSRRGTASQRGYNYKWQMYSKGFLKRNPSCVECNREGKMKAATVVDHIIPHKGDMKLFWDVKNHQPLCKRHHDSKTAREDSNWSRGRGVQISTGSAI